jgi:DNA-binding transcriptional regulator YdaS (Cro superfamily)
METSIEKAVRLAGGQTALARALGVTPQAVQQWVSRGIVPADKCPAIEKLLNRQVLCEELNHTVDWAYVRSCRSKPPAVTKYTERHSERRKKKRRKEDKE